MYSWKKIIMMISCMIMLVPLKSFASEDVPFEMLNYNLETKTVEEYTFKGNKFQIFARDLKEQKQKIITEEGLLVQMIEIW